MKIIKPKVITNTIFKGSNVPENDHPEWLVTSTYQIGNKVIVTGETHEIFESLVNGNIAKDPPTEPTQWLSLGATNRWKVFDKKISDPTINPTSITYQLQDAASVINAMSFFGLVAQTVNLTVTADGTEVYNKTADLNNTVDVTDWYSYFFTEITTDTETSFLDIPPFINSVLAITVTNAAGSNAQVGQIVSGFLTNIGLTTYGTSISIEDYSTKEVDAFGNFVITKRAFANIGDYNIAFNTQNARRIQNTLAALRAEPIVFIGSDDTSYGLTLYGFYRRFDLTLETPSLSFGSVEVEGLT